MLKIRLARLGKKKNPFYRIVVTDIRTRRNGAPLAELGFYNPIQKQLKLNKALAETWIAKGAQPSETTKWLLSLANDTGELIQISKPEKQKLSKKVLAKQKVEADAAAKAAEEAAAVEAAAPEEQAAPAEA
jgi:small subunit ribosomal protein S16